MTVKTRTPRTDLTYQATLRRMVDILEPLATELSLPIAAIDESLEGFAWLSTRYEFAKGTVDFDTIVPGDSSEGIRAKYLRYLDSQHMAAIVAARKAIREVDEPFDAALAPGAGEELEKNS